MRAGSSPMVFMMASGTRLCVFLGIGIQLLLVDGAAYTLAARHHVERLSWHGAMARCAAQGSQLVTPTYEEATEILRRALNSSRTLRHRNVPFQAAGSGVRNLLCPVRVLVDERQPNLIATMGRCTARRFFLCARRGDRLQGQMKPPIPPVARVHAVSQLKTPLSTPSILSALADRRIQKDQQENTTLRMDSAFAESGPKANGSIPSEPNKQNASDHNGISVVTVLTVCFISWNFVCFGICICAILCLDWRRNVRHAIHLSECTMLFFGQIFLLLSTCGLCQAVLGVQLHYVFAAALSFAALEGVHLIHANCSEKAPGAFALYVVAGCLIPLVLAICGVTVYSDQPYTDENLICAPLLHKGTGWFMLQPAITAIIVSMIALIHHMWPRYRPPGHETTHVQTLHAVQMAFTALLLGSQWIFGPLVRETDAMFVFFIVTGVVLLPTVMLMTLVDFDRECRSAAARRLGHGGKIARRIADLIRPAPQVIFVSNRSGGGAGGGGGDGGGDARSNRDSSQPEFPTSFDFNHKRPQISDHLRSTLERGIRPSIHLISPLELAPVQRQGARNDRSYPPR